MFGEPGKKNQDRWRHAACLRPRNGCSMRLAFSKWNSFGENKRKRTKILHFARLSIAGWSDRQTNSPNTHWTRNCLAWPKPISSRIKIFHFSKLPLTCKNRSKTPFACEFSFFVQFMQHCNNCTKSNETTHATLQQNIWWCVPMPIGKGHFDLARNASSTRLSRFLVQK